MTSSFQLSYIIFVTLALGACSQSSSNRTSHSTSVPSTSTTLQQTGKASYYANKYHGRQTANGERFNQNAKTAAHKKLHFGTWVKVTNVNNGKSVIVRINDRGPFVKGRIIDLSKSAFSAIANTRLGVINVIIEVIR